MLYYYAGGRPFLIEFPDAFISSIGIIDVVEREFLPLDPTRGGHSWPQKWSLVQSSELLGIFPISQGSYQFRRELNFVDKLYSRISKMRFSPSSVKGPPLWDVMLLKTSLSRFGS